MKIYFDKYGLLEQVEDASFQQTSNKIDLIEVYAGFDITKYVTTITFKRPDGMVLGAFKMNRRDDGSDFIKVYGQIIDIPGQLQMTIRYEEMINNISISTKTMSMITAKVLESVEKNSETIFFKDGKDGVDGKDGKDGANGKSAYEIAVDNGYRGTEKEWLNELRNDCIYYGSEEPNGTQTTWIEIVDEEINTLSLEQEEEAIAVCSLEAEEEVNTLVADTEVNTLVAEGNETNNVIADDEPNTLVADDIANTLVAD